MHASSRAGCFTARGAVIIFIIVMKFIVQVSLVFALLIMR